MKISQVGAQLYTLRNFLQLPADMVKSLRQVREIGYEAVQLSGMGPIDEAELLKMLDGEGLACAATHEDSITILDNTEKVIDHLAKLNCKYTAYPFPSGIDFKSKADVLELAKKLNAAGAKMHQAGQVLTYHNHSHEFKRFEGQTILEIIYENTEPQNLQAEPDTYWVQHGGGNPVAWINKMTNRCPLLHLKDYRIIETNTPTYAEIGNGNLDWPAIIAAADKAGCLWYFVEQDTCPGDPFDSLQQSFDYIKENLCE